MQAFIFIDCLIEHNTFILFYFSANSAIPLVAKGTFSQQERWKRLCVLTRTLLRVLDELGKPRKHSSLWYCMVSGQRPIHLVVRTQGLYCRWIKCNSNSCWYLREQWSQWCRAEDYVYLL